MPSGGLQVHHNGPGGGPRIGCWMGMRMLVSGNATECYSINLFFFSIEHRFFLRRYLLIE